MSSQGIAAVVEDWDNGMLGGRKFGGKDLCEPLEMRMWAAVGSQQS